MEIRVLNLALRSSSRYIDAVRLIFFLFTFAAILPPQANARGSQKPSSMEVGDEASLVPAPPFDLLQRPSAYEWKGYRAQSVSDIDAYWEGIKSRPEEFRIVGDIIPLYSLNRRAAEIWERALQCFDGDHERFRRAYAEGRFCDDPVESEDLKQIYSDIRGETRGWLATSVLTGRKDEKLFGRFGENDPIKKHSLEIYGAGQDYNSYLKLHTLWIQVVLEIAATNALYPKIDDKEWKRINETYLKSREENFQERLHREDYLEPLPSTRKNRAFLELYANVRSLHATLILLGWISPRDCFERGLYPEVAVVVSEGWNAPMMFLADPEFGKLYSSAATTATVWSELACGQPAFLKGLSGDSRRSVKNQAYRNFERVIHFYRGLDRFYGGLGQ